MTAFNRLGYFPVLDEVPAEVVGHIRRDLRLPEHVAPARTAERHRILVRARSEEVHDPAGARKVAADAIEEAVRRKNDPADLINIALEQLVEGSYELPGNIFTKLAIGSRRELRQAPSTLGHRTRGPNNRRSGRRRRLGSRR